MPADNRAICKLMDRACCLGAADAHSRSAPPPNRGRPRVGIWRCPLAATPISSDIDDQKQAVKCLRPRQSRGSCCDPVGIAPVYSAMPEGGVALGWSSLPRFGRLKAQLFMQVNQPKEPMVQLPPPKQPQAGDRRPGRALRTVSAGRPHGCQARLKPPVVAS